MSTIDVNDFALLTATAFQPLTNTPIPPTITKTLPPPPPTATATNDCVSSTWQFQVGVLEANDDYEDVAGFCYQEDASNVSVAQVNNVAAANGLLLFHDGQSVRIDLEESMCLVCPGDSIAGQATETAQPTQTTQPTDTPEAISMTPLSSPDISKENSDNTLGWVCGSALIAISGAYLGVNRYIKGALKRASS